MIILIKNLAPSNCSCCDSKFGYKVKAVILTKNLATSNRSYSDVTLGIKTIMDTVWSEIWVSSKDGHSDPEFEYRVAMIIHTKNLVINIKFCYKVKHGYSNHPWLF